MLSQIPDTYQQSSTSPPHPLSEISPQAPTGPKATLPHRKTLDEQLSSLWNTILSTTDSSLFCSSIKEYCLFLVNNEDEDIFVNYFIENKFMSMLRLKMGEWKMQGDILRTIFSLFQFLLKALKKDVQLIYFLVKVSQEGFITQDYVFQEEEDEAYYANFLKLMIRKINEDPKYLAVFINSREPHFPLLLQLLRMHDCKDTIMHTSSKLAILQISNNMAPLVQLYMRNFPFVLFYPLYVMRVWSFLNETLREEQGLSLEHLESSIKYLEDFVEGKERVVIDMYTNAFLVIVGRYLYDELTNLNEKILPKAVKLLKILSCYVFPQISVVKIRIGLLCLFAPLVPVKMKAFLESKVQQLELRYWIPETCSEEVESHCRAVFYNQAPQNRSILRSINSYIPRSRDNWLYHELKKVSTVIGYEIDLNQSIDVDHSLKQSCLYALETMIDDQLVRNSLFTSILSRQSEELIYYYLGVLDKLCDLQEAKSLLQLEQMIQVMTTCTSLSLLQAFHSLVCKSKLNEAGSPYINQAYYRVLQKITHFVMTKGWGELLARAKDIPPFQPNQTFTHDIYRELQCDILLFVTLRALLGTTNTECSSFSAERWAGYPIIVVETIFKSSDSSRFGPLLYIILDGQFLILKNSEEKVINKQELLLTDLDIYQSSELIEVLGNSGSGNFCVSLYLESNLKGYLLREVRIRKEMAQKYALELKQLRFELS